MLVILRRESKCVGLSHTIFNLKDLDFCREASLPFMGEWTWDCGITFDIFAHVLAWVHIYIYIYIFFFFFFFYLLLKFTISFLKNKKMFTTKTKFCFNVVLAGLLEVDCHCWIPIPVCLLSLGRCCPSSLCYAVKMSWGLPPAMVGFLYLFSCLVQPWSS